MQKIYVILLKGFLLIVILHLIKFYLNQGKKWYKGINNNYFLYKRDILIIIKIIKYSLLNIHYYNLLYILFIKILLLLFFIANEDLVKINLSKIYQHGNLIYNLK